MPRFVFCVHALNDWYQGNIFNMQYAFHPIHLACPEKYSGNIQIHFNLMYLYSNKGSYEVYKVSNMKIA